MARNFKNFGNEFNKIITIISGIKNKVFEQLDAFVGIPFTVQQLAELLKKS